MNNTGPVPAVRYHSEQAMAAARKMRSTKRRDMKRRTGQMVCHHLKMMLNGPSGTHVTGIARLSVVSDLDRPPADLPDEQAQIQLGF